MEGGYRDERFAKTAVEWIPREMPEHDSDGAREFVDTLLGCLPNEAIRSAVKACQGTQETRADEQDSPTYPGDPTL